MFVLFWIIDFKKLIIGTLTNGNYLPDSPYDWIGTSTDIGSSAVVPKTVLGTICFGEYRTCKHWDRL